MSCSYLMFVFDGDLLVRDQGQLWDATARLASSRLVLHLQLACYTQFHMSFLTTYNSLLPPPRRPLPLVLGEASFRSRLPGASSSTTQRCNVHLEIRPAVFRPVWSGPAFASPGVSAKRSQPIAARTIPPPPSPTGSRSLQSQRRCLDGAFPTRARARPLSPPLSLSVYPTYFRMHTWRVIAGLGFVVVALWRVWRSSGRVPILRRVVAGR